MERNKVQGGKVLTTNSIRRANHSNIMDQKNNSINIPVCQQGKMHIPFTNKDFVITQPCERPRHDCPQRPTGPGAGAIIDPGNLGRFRTPGIDVAPHK